MVVVMEVIWGQGGGDLEIFAKERRFQRFAPWGRAQGVLIKGKASRDFGKGGYLGLWRWE